MPYQVVGAQIMTKVFTATTTPGIALSFPVAVKSFIIKPVGGNIAFRFNSTDTDANAFPVNDGEAIQFDVALPFVGNLVTIGYAMGSCPVYVAVAF